MSTAMIELQSVDEYGNLYAIDTFLTVADAEQTLAELKAARKNASHWFSAMQIDERIDKLQKLIQLSKV